MDVYAADRRSVSAAQPSSGKSGLRSQERERTLDNRAYCFDLDG
jgi:hypothetical protein